MTEPASNAPNRIVFFFYGLLGHVMFLAIFMYMIGFLGNLVVPKSIDSGTAGPVGQAIAINVGLILLFGVPHSIMARPGFKSWWTKRVPVPIERSTYVWISNVALILLLWQWRPMPETVWQVDHSVGTAVLYGLFGFGWFLVVYSSFLIDHFDLLGTRHVFLYLRGREYTAPGFKNSMAYRLVRNPLMLGWFIAFWCTPSMSQGHLLFAIGLTAYGFVGILCEERDHKQFLGEAYQRYRSRTPMILPWPRPRVPAPSRVPTQSAASVAESRRA